MVLSKVNNKSYPGQVDYLFFCPGCKCGHIFTTKWDEKKVENRKKIYEHGWRPPLWSFNNNMEKPTFTPSLLISTEAFEEIKPTVCHLYLTDGVIEFLSDCTHAFKGQKVPLPSLVTSY